MGPRKIADTDSGMETLDDLEHLAAVARSTTKRARRSRAAARTAPQSRPTWGTGHILIIAIACVLVGGLIVKLVQSPDAPQTPEGHSVAPVPSVSTTRQPAQKAPAPATPQYRPSSSLFDTSEPARPAGKGQ